MISYLKAVLIVSLFVISPLLICKSVAGSVHPPFLNASNTLDGKLRMCDQEFVYRSFEVEAEGRIKTEVFRAPKILQFEINGVIQADSTSLFLESSDGEKFGYTPNGVWAHSDWRKVEWTLPDRLLGKPIRMVAQYHGKSLCLGFRNVAAISKVQLIGRQFKSLLFIPLVFIYLLVLIIPSVFFVSKMSKVTSFSNGFEFPLVLLISYFVGYGMFWIVFLNSKLGCAFSSIFYFGFAILCLIQLKLKRLAYVFEPEFFVPLGLSLGCALFYLSILYAIDPAGCLSVNSGYRFLPRLPPDNIIPYLFAERLFEGSDPRHILGDWLSSDRPPLQSGLVLVSRFLFSVLRLDGEIHYQILSTIVQSFWVGLTWSLGRVLKLNRRAIHFVLISTIFSGFFLLNSVFTWPKLLASNLVIISIIFIYRSKNSADWFLVGTAMALALLSHGGAVFTLVPVGVLMLGKMKFRLKSIPYFLAAFLLLTVPWELYKKYYNPPGDRLVKWHLGGFEQIDSRSVLKTIRDAYSDLSWTEIARYKLENVNALFNIHFIEDISRSFKTPKLFFEIQREHEFLHLFSALGILNFGWLFFIWALFSIHGKQHLKAITKPTALAFASVCVWVTLMFGPGATILHQGSYANVLLLYLVLGACLSQLKPALGIALLLIHIGLFFSCWVFTSSLQTENVLSSTNWPVVASSILFGSVLFYGLLAPLVRPGYLHETDR